MADQPVLVLTALDDPTSDVVIAELNDRDVPVVRCDPGEVMTGGVELAARYPGAGPSGLLRTPSRELALRAIRSVYYRRPSPYTAPESMSPYDGAFAIAQARFGLGGVLSTLRCRWVNHVWSAVGAEYKPAQLAAATAAGLRVPATLVTNVPAEARAFAAEHSPIVYKPLYNTELRSESGDLEMIWVRTVDPAELDESIAHAVHMFQERVEKVADVRTTVVGDRVFSVRIDSPELDWRSNYDAAAYAVIDTPAAVIEACRAYLERFGLLFGAFDFALQPDNGWVFYECNTAGQWHWLEEQTGLPMTAAIADLLQADA